jgi:hypothetical protein
MARGDVEVGDVQAESLRVSAAIVSVGFSIATVNREGTSTAWYGADRAAALLVAAVVVVSLGRRTGLLVVGWMLAAVQATDAVIGLASGSVTNTIGPAVLAVATALALVRLGRAPG